MRRPLLNMAKLPSQRAGFAVGRWVLLGPSQVSTCKVVLPARSRAGIQAFSKRKPGRKESRGRSPAPPFLRPLAPARSAFGSVPHCHDCGTISVPFVVP